jgi:hypothetical protein
MLTMDTTREELIPRLSQWESLARDTISILMVICDTIA